MSESLMEIQENKKIPNGWIWTNVGKVIEKVPLTGKKLKQSEYQERARLPVIDQGHTYIGGYTNEEELKISSECPLVIFGDHTKVVKYVDFDFVAGADGIKVLKPREIFFPKLFYYFIQAIRLPDKGYARHFQFLEKSSIPLPPLSEQHRIVEKIEELLTKLDAGVDYLRKIQAQLKRYRQSVLKAAVEGKLTEEWREKHRDELEPASVLLERILKERREKWEAKQLGMFREKGKVPKDGKWKGKYKEPAKPEIDSTISIPENWVWATMQQLSTKVVDGVHKKPDYVMDGIPFLTVRNMTAGSGIDFENVKYITQEAHKEYIARTNPEKGDILITKDGTLGVTRVIKTDKEFSIFVSLAMMKPIKEHLNTFYLAYVIKSPFGQHNAKNMGEGSGLQHLHLEDLRTMIFPLPPLCEQHEIVGEIERHLSVVEEVELTINSELTRAERLRQSILKQAFSGKLIPQNPTDEPASVLLERIKAEKAKLEKENKSRKSIKREKKPKQMELL